MNIKVSEIVASYLDGKNYGAAEYAKTYAVAIWGWRELNWDIVGRVRTVEVCPNHDGTIDIPEDFLNISDFGVANGEGNIASFDRTDDINLCYTDHRESPSNVRGDFRGSGSLDWLNSGSLGVGSYETIGYYKIDAEERKIYVKSNTANDNFLLKYLSYNNVEGEYELNALAAPALKSYIRWQLSLDDRQVGLGEKFSNERMYYNEKRKAKLRIKKLTIQELNKAARESEKLAVKS